MTSFWRGLSIRERFLIIVTVGVLVSAVFFFGMYRAYGTFNRIDMRIAQLEQELVNLAEQEAKSASAEVAFQGMAAEHSSAWTEEEIQDRLRQEIHRLALHDVETVNPTQQDYMVRYQRLPPGALNSEADGYREFTLSFNLEPAPLVNVLRFVERLQKSRQSLRVDMLDMRRPAGSTLVTASIQITRTVLDSDPNRTMVAQTTDNLLANAGFEEWENKDRATGWEGEGCALSRSAQLATEGSWCLEAAAEQESGQVYQIRKLPKGYTYRLSVDITSDGPASLGIADADTGVALEGGHTIEGDGQTYRYELKFTPPESTRTTPLQAPLITLEKVGTKVHLDNARLERVEVSP